MRDAADAPSRQSDRPRSLPRRIARIAAVALVTLLVAELALRSAAWVAGDRIARLRDDPALLQDADVAVYGDSTPFGLGASTSFPRELAIATGEKVVNRSQPGINSSQTAVILREDLTRYRPRVIVVEAGVNDAWNLADVDPDLLGPLGAWRRYLPEPRLWRLARIWLTTGPGATAYDTMKPGRGDWKRRFETEAQLGPEEVAKITRRSFDRMIAAASANGAEILFLGYQAPGWHGSADAVSALLSREYPDRFIDLRSLFAGREAELILPDAIHPTDAGHRVIAERLRDELARRGLLREHGARS